MKPLKVIFDAETNGLNPDIIWMIATEDLDGDKGFFTDYEDGYPSISEGLAYLSLADVLIGHNIISYDLPVLKKLCNWQPAKSQKLVDTMLLSQMNDFERPQFDHLVKNKFAGKHNMKVWSQFLGGEEKHEDPSWLEYSIEMRERCISDVSINVKMYRYMMQEIKAIVAASPNYGQSIKLEHDLALAMADQEANGWLIDTVAAKKLLAYIEVEMSKIELEVEPLLKPQKVYLDKEPREAKRLLSGAWDRVTRDWFGDREVISPYQRFRIVEMKLGNNEAVINLLLENGWVPTEWNWGRTEEGQFFKKSPKLTEDSYDSIKGDLGKSVAYWRVLRSRRGFITGIFKNIREDGHLSCRAFTVGTNTFRCRHAGIVNVPGAYAVLGKEIRSLFHSAAGRSVVAADSDGNQLRGMAHYVNNPEVSTAIVSGSNDDGTDIHTRTANIVGVSRPVVKNLTYALIFGAGDNKLGETAGMKGEGPALRAKMESAYEGLKPAIDNLKYQWMVNRHTFSRGFIYGLDGRRIYCEDHKAFNALLQGFEAVTCKAACVEAVRMIKAEGLDAKVIAFYHDEINCDVADKDTQRVGEILEYCLGPYVTEKYNLNIAMGGTAQVGNSWYDVH
jgi:DNA polymerase-1